MIEGAEEKTAGGGGRETETADDEGAYEARLRTVLRGDGDESEMTKLKGSDCWSSFH